MPLAPKVADEQFVVGERYHLEHREDRSELSHRHEFAWIDEAWAQLPEALADLYPSPLHLRKRALIDTGFFNEEVIDCGSRAAALRVASFTRRQDDFAHVVTRGPIVVVRTAKSQSRRAMDKQEFQASKDAILELIAGMLGITPEELQRNTKKAA